MTISCPKCASCEGLSVEAIYCESCADANAGVSSFAKFWNQAAPPNRRHPMFWMALTALFMVLSVSGLLTSADGVAAFAICAVLSGWMIYEAHRYNRADLPRLVEYWHLSFICTRCGEVYVPS